MAAITGLVAQFDARGDVLPRPPAAIRVTLPYWVVAQHADAIVGCGALCPYSPAIGEIRTIVVRD